MKKHELKSTLPRSRHAPAFVSRRMACALLDLSPSGFNRWVRDGILPPPASGTPPHEPRWDWAEVRAWLHGDRSSAGTDLFGDSPPVRLGNKPGPQRGHGGRPRLDAKRNTAPITNGSEHGG